MKFDLLFDPPWMNAAGSLHYVPDLNGPTNLTRFGAFVTNPISRQRRTLAQSVNFGAYPGGFLMHTGHPNPGLSAVLRKYAAAWGRSPLPVIVHLLAQNADELAHMIPRLEGLAGINGVEIGLPPDIALPEAAAMARAAAGELPVIVKLPLEQAAALAETITQAANSQVFAFSLGPPRGAQAVPGGVQTGRLYGPAIFPLALAAVRSLARLGLPVIGAGGIYTQADGQAMLDAGAMAVQLDAVLWRGDFFFSK